MLPLYPCLLGTVNLVTVSSFTISNQLVDGEAHEVNICTVFTFKSVWSYEVTTHHSPRSCYDQLWWYMTILLAVSLVFLARSARFDIWPDSIVHTFPVHHGSNCLFKTWVAMIIEIVVIPTDCPVGSRNARMINLSFLHSTFVSSISWKWTSFSGVLHFSYNRSLILDIWFVLF